jgi:hypothetical protein
MPLCNMYEVCDGCLHVLNKPAHDMVPFEGLVIDSRMNIFIL